MPLAFVEWVGHVHRLLLVPEHPFLWPLTVDHIDFHTHEWSVFKKVGTATQPSRLRIDTA
jgi:hypothetical protein